VEYYQLLRRNDLEHLISPELMINVHGLVINIGADGWLLRGLLMLMVVLLVAAACWRAPLWQWIAAVSAGSLLVPPHVYGYDAALLLLPLWLAIFMSPDKTTRLAAMLVCTPLPFLMTLAGTPWAASTPLALLGFLLCLSRNLLRRPRPDLLGQTPARAQ
jgi:hypothetical protein